MTKSFGVCMITTHYYPHVGGAEKQAERLGSWLTEQGVAVNIITRRLPDTEAHEVQDGIDIWRVPTLPSKALSALSFIIMSCVMMFRLRKQFDVIHTHQIFSPTTVGWVMSRILGKPLIVNLHGGGPRGDLGRLLRNQRSGQLRLNQLARDVAMFISISEEISNELLDAGVDKEKIRLLVNSVNINEFAPVDADTKRTLRQDLHLPPDVPIVVFVGRLVAGKGLEVLMDAWQNVSADAHLVVIGTGELEASLREQAQQEFPNTVHIVGLKRNVVEYLQACDIWVLPSFSEGLPLSLLEAMSCAMPVISTPVGAIPSIIEEGVNGWLVPKGNAEALADVLTNVIQLDANVLAVGQTARQSIIEHYSLDTSGRAYYNLYQDVIAD